jgi:hypothetical protein
MLPVIFVFGRRKIAGISVERFHEAVQRAFGHRRDVGLLYVFLLDAGKDFAKNAELAIGAVVGRCMNAESADKSESDQDEAEAKDYRLRDF